MSKSQRSSSVNFLFLSSETSSGPQEQPLLPITLFDSDQVYSCNPDNSTRISRVQAKSSHSIFIPPSCASQDLSDDHFPIPDYLLTIAKSVLRDSRAIASMSLDPFGKPTETVDWGEDADFTGYEWFKDAPPRQEPAPPPVISNYVPQPGVIEQNEMFDFALKCAPNVLYARFKQFGQLGVLAWCSEFSELIEALKSLGVGGNMFVTTRTQALKTCEDILKLKLKIEMQIIVMYLSSQVARLRRFLDADRQWDDYPELNFPLDPRNYQS